MRTLVPIFLGIGCIGGCSSGHIQTHRYWGTTTERPAVGSTFDWAPSAPATPRSFGPPDERLDRLVRERIESEMAGLGFQKRSGDRPADLLLTMRLGHGFQADTAGPQDRGVLAVEIIDAADGHLIYLGWAETTVDPSLTPEERKARIERAVHEVLEPLRPT